LAGNVTEAERIYREWDILTVAERLTNKLAAEYKPLPKEYYEVRIWKNLE